MNKVKIRPIELLDVSKIIKIGKSIVEFRVDSNVKSFWSKKQLENWITSKKDSLILAEINNKIVGFVFFAHHAPTGKVTFENAWVDNNLRCTGIIDDLVKEGVKDLKKKGAVYLFSLVKTDNLASIKFFEKNKFIKGFDFLWLSKKI